ncbi:hypothetical protein E5S67_01063 [Microcoleus sp. IPMA8]|uniref:Uncharacterized protein n=1 Tax=Microcoleus asticus IPMA8 TaxID=2563858 RepID=A0ABX2CSF7_9CYAN|nr:hypothetical protein [Microcoleus asticus IPMA8]
MQVVNEKGNWQIIYQLPLLMRVNFLGGWFENFLAVAFDRFN